MAIKKVRGFICTALLTTSNLTTPYKGSYSECIVTYNERGTIIQVHHAKDDEGEDTAIFVDDAFSVIDKKVTHNGLSVLDFEYHDTFDSYMCYKGHIVLYNNDDEKEVAKNAICDIVSERIVSFSKASFQINNMDSPIITELKRDDTFDFLC